VSARQKPARNSISATSLATLGLCEHQLGLTLRHGDHKATAQQEVFIARGNVAHERSLHAARATPRGAVTDRRCFIATAVYGPEAEQTNALRAWRDRVLMATRRGRLLIRIYYRLSPRVVHVLDRHPSWMPLVRRLLDRLAEVIGVQP